MAAPGARAGRGVGERKIMARRKGRSADEEGNGAGRRLEGDELLSLKLRKRRNVLPEDGIRVPAQDMRDFVKRVFEKVGTSREDAELLGEILVLNDLRCLFSHGTRQIVAYARNMIAGTVNPRPEVKVVSESPGALVMDGDGGLGYFPCHHGTQRAIEKARTCGIAALTTSNHHHFGAASNYSRQALAHDCIGISMSTSRTKRNPENPIYRIMSSSPMSVAIPSGDQPPIVLDMGGPGVGFKRTAYEENSAPIFKALGMTAVIQALGGVFAGIYREELLAPQSRWESNQGSFIAVVDVSHFMALEVLRKEMDAYITEARAMQPFPGIERAELAGGFEWAWAQENERAGIPVGDKHRAELEEVAAEVGVSTLFERFDDTRFEVE